MQQVITNSAPQRGNFIWTQLGTGANVEPNVSELLGEQRRTTHAVRAIAFFILILFPTQLLGGVLIYWGVQTRAACGRLGCYSWEPDGSWQMLLGAVIILGGVIGSIVVGWSQLSQSYAKH